MAYKINEGACTFMLSREQLAQKLHNDHVESRNFMHLVADAVTPVVEKYSQAANWHNLEVPEPVVIPALWHGLQEVQEDDGIPYYHVTFNSEDYINQCPEDDINTGKYDNILNQTYFMLYVATVADLYRNPKNDLNINMADVHHADRALLSYTPQVPLAEVEPDEDEEEDAGTLGETIVTNIGVGEEAAYYKLHEARVKCAVFIGTYLKPIFAEIAEQHSSEVEKLTRALSATNEGKYARPGYNPLFHSFLEGTMSVGQAMNYFTQSGIDGEMNLADIREIAKGPHAAIMSKLILSGHLGPNQVAGLAPKNALVRSPGKIQINPKLLDRYRSTKEKARAEILTLSDKDLDWLQYADVQSVNRAEGCPATRLVRLASQMHYDALNS